MSKAEKIANWLSNGGMASFGNLHLFDDAVFTYNVKLGRINREARTAVVNSASYSVTSSGHRNRLLEALQMRGYEVTMVEGASEV